MQTGDPTNTGKGGGYYLHYYSLCYVINSNYYNELFVPVSIWGRKFEDEFTDELKHKNRGYLSMVNH